VTPATATTGVLVIVSVMPLAVEGSDADVHAVKQTAAATSPPTSCAALLRCPLLIAAPARSSRVPSTKGLAPFARPATNLTSTVPPGGLIVFHR